MEVYVDNILVMSKLTADRVQDLDLMFKVLCRY